MLSSMLLLAQYNQNAPWMKELNSTQKRTGKKPTFKEVQQAFETYWLTHDKNEKGSGYKPFKRFENIWSSRVDENGYLPSVDDTQKAWQQKESFVQTNRMADQSNWYPIGPYDYAQANAQPAGMGRLNCITIDPNNSDIWYVGAPGGGLWKTMDAGSTWTPLTDNLPRVSVSAVAVDYNDSNTIYITTGDDDAVYVYASSIGVYKSTDGGITWSVTGLNTNNINGSRALSEIFIDPTDSNKLVCSGTDGVYTTTDAGVTWTQTLAGENIRDLRIKPGDAQTVYAVSPTAFYKSTDGGVNFTQITNGVPTNTHRMVIDVTPANANYVYLFSVDETNRRAHGIYRSTNSGDSFSLRNTDSYTLIGNWQVWYNMAMGVSDTNAEEVYVGTMDVWRSSNGGTTWNKLNRWDQLTPAYTHADIHSLRAHNGRMFCASDGGIYSTIDNGTSFQNHSTGLQIGEFFNVAIAQGNINNVCGGLQDNGGFGLGVNGDWRGYHPGDGINSVIAPTDDDTYYGLIQNGDRLYVSNRADGFITSVFKPSNAGTGVFETPMAADGNGEIYAAWGNLFRLNKNTYEWDLVGALPGYTDELIVAPSDPMRIVSSGHQNLRVSTDGGVTYDFDTNVVGNSISDIEIHATNPDIMWITTDGDYANKGVFKTTDGGYTWTDITSNLPSGEFLNAVEFQADHPLNPIFVSTDLGVYRLDDSSPNWEPFLINLPNADIRDIEINLDDQSITAATYGRGLWRSSIPIQLLQNDVSIRAITNPTSAIINCGDISPQIQVRSNGINDITEINITYGVSGGTTYNHTWNGMLQSNEEATISLPAINVGAGTFTLDVNATITNDGNAGNNIRSQNFSVNASGDFNMTNSFENPEDELIIENGVWQRGVPSGSALNSVASGTQAYATNLSGDYPTDANAYLVSNCYDFTQIIDPVLKFQMAYILEAGWDWANVQYSLNGGQTWENLGTVNSQPNWYNNNDDGNGYGCPGCPGGQWTGANTTMTEYGYDFTANAALGETDLTNEDNVVFRMRLVSDSVITEEGIVLDDFVVEGKDPIEVAPKVLLQGASVNPNVGEENLMRDDLRVANMIPIQSPYTDGLTCRAEVFDVTGTNAIVDWVWVELRDGTTNTTVIASQSALLQRDGDVVNTDGVSTISFVVPEGNYHIAIKHRNHLGIMTNTNVAFLEGLPTTVDFTETANQNTFGTNAQTTFGMPAGKTGMWSGNVNGDVIVQYSGTTPDAPSILSVVLNDAGNFLNFPTYVINGYSTYDVDLNGRTQYSGTTPDTPYILQNVLAHPGNFLNFSTYQIQEQLPTEN